VTTSRPAPVFLTPGDNQQPLRVAKEGSVLRLLDIEGEWYHVEFEDPQFGRRVGYIRKAYGTVNAPDYSRMPSVDLSIREDAPATQPAARPQTTPRATAAATARAIRRGTTELLLTGSFSAVNGGGETATLLMIESTVGYFATPHLEIGADLSALKVSNADPVGTAAGLVAYNFNPDEPAVGFAGGAVGAGFGLGNHNPFLFQLFGGVRVLTPGGGGAFVVRPFYERESFARAGDANVFGVALGVSILF